MPNFNNAEDRLCAENSGADSINDDNIDDSKLVIFVQLECFGKATGLLYPALYKSPSAKCISCRTCGKPISTFFYISLLSAPLQEILLNIWQAQLMSKN